MTPKEMEKRLQKALVEQFETELVLQEVTRKMAGVGEMLVEMKNEIGKG